MAIRFVCDCGKKLSAPDFYAGREGKCSHCGKKFTIPGEPVQQRALRPESAGGVAVLTYQLNPKAAAKTAAPKRKLRDYSYLLLLLALRPLFWTLVKGESPGKRLDKTLKEASPAGQARVAELKELMNIQGTLPAYSRP